MGEPNYSAEMQLPPGKTCADCVSIRRCTAFGFSAADNAYCDFWPSRFQARRIPEIEAHTWRFSDPAFTQSFA